MKEEEIKERFATYLKAKGITINKFASDSGLPQTTISRQVNGQVSMSGKVLITILEFFPDMSAEWLFRGEGPMTKNQSHGDLQGGIGGEDNSVKADNPELVDRLLDRIDKKDEQISNLIKQLVELIANNK